MNNIYKHLTRFPATLTEPALTQRKKRWQYTRVDTMRIYGGFHRPYRALYFMEGIVYHRLKNSPTKQR